MGKRLLVAGLPRGGTTWIGAALGTAPGALYLHEPDNWAIDPLAHLSQQEVGRFPVLAADAHAPVYDVVWRLAMRGGWPAAGAVARARELSYRLPRPLAIPVLLTLARFAARRLSQRGTVIAKTVQGLGALEWLAARHADGVVVVRTDPRSVVSSWRALGWGPGHLGHEWFERHRPHILARVGGWPEDPVGQAALAVGGLQSLLDEAVTRHPDWTQISHEDLCTSPAAGFRALFEQVGLPFGPETERYLIRSDAQGAGLETRRRTAEQPDRWRRLPAAELRRVEEILARVSEARATSS
jgi:hypothetical protein